MNDLTAERHLVVEALSGVGLAATVDPGDVLNLVNRYGVCALVQPADTFSQATFGLGLTAVVPVWLLTSGPYDNDAAERLDAALLAAWPATRPMEPVTRDTYEAADVSMPALIIPASRNIPC